MRLAEQKLDLHILLNCDNRNAFGSSRAGSRDDAEITFDELVFARSLTAAAALSLISSQRFLYAGPQNPELKRSNGGGQRVCRLQRAVICLNSNAKGTLLKTVTQLGRV
jgi:hypothetical protein